MYQNVSIRRIKHRYKILVFINLRTPGDNDNMQEMLRNIHFIMENANASLCLSVFAPLLSLLMGQSQQIKGNWHMCESD
jgi:hypothetical protein